MGGADTYGSEWRAPDDPLGCSVTFIRCRRSSDFDEVMTRKADQVSIVLRGAFNPAILSPGWLLAQELATKGEVEDAKVQVITQHIATFDISSINIQVLDDRLSVQTEDPEEFERARDLVVSILTVLSHTPVASMGINRTAHLEIESYDAWHALGDRLAPKDLWEPEMTLPGLRSLLMEGVRPDTNEGYIWVKIEPSLLYPHSVIVEHNDHYALAMVESQATSRAPFLEANLKSHTSPESAPAKVPIAIEILNTYWLDSLERAAAIFKKVESIVP